MSNDLVGMPESAHCIRTRNGCPGACSDHSLIVSLRSKELAGNYLPDNNGIYISLLQKKSFARRFRNDLAGGQTSKPPRLMPVINRGGRFLLTEAVIENRLVKSINRGDHYK
jgi:hypothetical protein